MRARSAAILAASFALAYACGSRTHAFSLATAAAATNPGAAPATGATGAASSAGSARGAASGANLSAAVDVAVLGDDVHFTLHVTNNSTRKLELTFPNGRTHDLVVLDAAGGEVWRWSTGQMFTQALRNQRLDPHASLSYVVRWRRPQVHGALTAVGMLTSTNYPVESRAPFALP